MTINEGVLDRTLRVILGLAILSLTVVGPKTLWGLIGIAPVLTGAIGLCPLYTLIGVTTCSKEQKSPT
jgi:hypothetical protein